MVQVQFMYSSNMVLVQFNPFAVNKLSFRWWHVLVFLCKFLNCCCIDTIYILILLFVYQKEP